MKSVLVGSGYHANISVIERRDEELRFNLRTHLKQRRGVLLGQTLIHLVAFIPARLWKRTDTQARERSEGQIRK